RPTLTAAGAALALQPRPRPPREVAYSFPDELAPRAPQADQTRATHIQRAQHAADAARRRYLAVDPTNRLVAETLEADWNHKLRELADAQDDYDRAKSDIAKLDQAQRERVRALAGALPAPSHNPATP